MNKTDKHFVSFCLPKSQFEKNLPKKYWKLSLGIHKDCIEVLMGEVWSELDKLLTKLDSLQTKKEEVAKGLIVGLARFLMRKQF